MNIMKIHAIRRVGQNRLEYDYTVDGEWCRYFEMSNPMWVEYSVPVNQVPDSIAVLPLIGNVIVLASLMDADIYVEEIDQDFYECIEEFLKGFDEIMPNHIHFKLRDIVHAKKVIANPLSETAPEENLLFFSGGVDATCSLVTHMDEKPSLVTIWGADIPWDNEETWNRAIGFNQEVADRHNLKLLTIRSNLRKSLHDDNINALSYQLTGNWWWPAFHHGVAMMCLAAPLAYRKRKYLYLASSFTSKDLKDWGTVATGSAPQIDNHVHFCGCQVVHDGSNFSRFEKIRHICQYYEHEDIKPYLRVCYHSHTGKNCGICEKCARDTMTIHLLGHNPEDYGFPYQEDLLPQTFASGAQEMARTEKAAFLSFYKDIQTALREQYSVGEIHPVLRTFYDSDLETLVEFLHVPNNEYLAHVNRSREIQDELYQQIGQLQYRLESGMLTNKEHNTEHWDSLANELTLAKEKNHVLEETNRTLEENLQQIYYSRSWKVTKPLRYVNERLRKMKNIKPKLKEKIYYAGLNVIRRRIPESSWKHEYVKLRWWFICSDHYETRFKQQFKKLLKEYKGTGCPKNWLTRFDYWLCWIFLGSEPPEYFDFEFFRKGWFWRNHHITTHRFNYIFSAFNDGNQRKLLDDKTQFNKYFNNYVKRKWCVPHDVSFEEFQALFDGISRIIVKPTSAYGGKGIYTLEIDPSNIESVYDQLHSSEKRTIVEEYVYQKGFLNDVSPTSLNPLRVTTLRIGDQVEVIYAFFTAGCNGNVVANDCSGGISFPIDCGTGKMGVGQGFSTNNHRKHPDTGISVTGELVPDWTQIKEFACKAHREAPEGLNLIGWDICWNDGNLSLVEGNAQPGFPELPDRREDLWKVMQGYLESVFSHEG